MAKRSQLPRSEVAKTHKAGPKAAVNTRVFLAVIVVAVVLVLAGVLLLQARAVRPPAETTTRTGDGTAWGPKDANVVIVDYSDFGCGHCRTFALNQGHQLRSEYEPTSKVRFEYKHFIIGGPDTANAANAAECAADQGRFWDYHDLLFSRQGSGQGVFAKKALQAYGAELGLGSAVFNACVDGDKHLEKVYRDASEGQGKGVTGTPTFFINGQALEGAVPYEQMKAAVDAALASSQ